MKGPSEKRDQFAVLLHEGWADGHTPLCPPPKNRVQASSSGEHVQLFRMVYDRKKGFQAEHSHPSLLVPTWV